MSDSNNDCYSFRNEYFGIGFGIDKKPEISNEELAEQIGILSEKIKDIEIKLSGKFGVLYVPTKEEIIQITKEQLIEEYKRINNGS